MNRSWKREAIDIANPEQAAERTATRFEREAVAVPEALVPGAEAPPWQVKALNDATELYRDLVLAGDEGIPLRDLGEAYGSERRAAAVRALRASGLVTEAPEQRAGWSRALIVLRAS